MRLPTASRPILALLLMGSLLLGRPAWSQAAPPGRAVITVVDSATGAPVANARVEVPGVQRAAFTDRAGVVQVAAPPGTRLVTVSRLGYAPGRAIVEFSPEREAARTVTLLPVAVQVRRVAVTAARREAGLDRRGFYDRQRRGFGAFMTGEEIDHIRPIRTVDLFRRMRGFRVAYTRSGTPYVTISRGTVGLRNCRSILLLVDGMPMASLTSPSEAMDMIPPEAIAGIEAYAGPASVPAEFNTTGSACGVVVIWTRTAP